MDQSALNKMYAHFVDLVAVYNMVPDKHRALNSVKDFQRAVQDIVKERVKEGSDDWVETLSPRIALMKHPLRSS